MSASDKKRIVALQKMVVVARKALDHLRHERIAEDALDEMMRLDLASRPTPLVVPMGRERARQ
ncbi:hypothetical protein [Aureimonas flava]|uniref:hypothetical protein n=1 Tax=Aureimonas flava TaxID=2320271 RepID=UPI001459FBD7|nr:hypothetical protein [Aureimonas flava]